MKDMGLDSRPLLLTERSKRHRLEIDGLRAVAAIAVIMNHAKAPIAGGGFIGVDIFFVISGFLITLITIAEIDKGSFTFAGFYERRVRRILPALFLVCGVTTLGAFLLFHPDDAKNYISSLIATLALVANFHFYFNQDYFATSSELELLLHTWTLGVEEQFYLFFPIFLYVFYVRRLSTFAIAGVLVFSLGLAVAAGDRSAAFYLLPYRAWEFAVGALIAIARHRALYEHWSNRSSEIGIVIAMILIGVAIAMPGEGAEVSHLMMAVGGAALILLFGDRSQIAKVLLANRVAVYLGGISYSLYLWHQPVFVFARYRAMESLAFSDYLLLLVLVLVLSHFSYRLVESPFRDRIGMRFSRVIAGLAAMLLPISVLGVVLATGVTWSAMSIDEPAVTYITASAPAARSRTWSLMRDASGQPGEQASDIRVGVVGNSHAKDFHNALLASRFAHTIEFVPLISNELCRQPGQTALLALFLPMSRQKAQLERCRSGHLYLHEHLAELDAIVIAPLWDQKQIDALPALLKLAESYEKSVLIVGNTARFAHVPRSVNNLIVSGLRDIDTINGSLSSTRSDESKINDQLRTFATIHGVPYLDRERLVCTGQVCDLTNSYGEWNLYDSGHWTLEGAETFGARLNTNTVLNDFVSSLQEAAARGLKNNEP